jgi:transcriptional regulator with XRE-family HTH domain
MTHTATPNKRIHEGRNVKRFREMLGIKQEALAFELGEEWNQKKVSILEQKESIEASILQKVSGVLKIPVEAIKNFDEEQAIYNISCNFSDYAVNNNGINFQQVNPIDKITQLHEEKIALYERMLKEKEEMIARLEKLVEGK